VNAFPAPEAAATRTTAVRVAANDPQARVKLTRALAPHPDLRLCIGPLTRPTVAADGGDDLLVLHWDAIGNEELSLIAELKRQLPDRPIVAVCESKDGQSARRAVDAGLDGLVFEDQLGSALGPTVAAVLAGQTTVPRTLRACLRGPSLSFREKQILGMVVMGFTNAEIASRLFVAESTVKSHLSTAFRKLGVQSRSEAASLILDPQGSLGPGILAITGGTQVCRRQAGPRG